VLSRSFVRQALLHPPTGLEAEIRHFYLTKAKLRSVIQHAKALMEKGDAAASPSSDAEVKGMEEEAEEEWNEDALGSLSTGAILMLRRTVAALETVAVDRESGAP
jgi:ubiquitin-conjugating enzyme E2 O